MKKPIIKNWMKYWASTLAVSGMLVMGACGNEERASDEVETEIESVEEVGSPAYEDVSRDVEEVETEEYEEEEATPVTEATRENVNNTTFAGSGWNDRISDYDVHLEKFREENEAIRQTLSEMTMDDRENLGDKEEANYDEAKTVNLDMAIEESPMYSVAIYDVYLTDPSQNLTEEEKMFLEDAKKKYEQRRLSEEGQMNSELNAYYFPTVEAQPKVKYDELAEEIQEEMNFPKYAEESKMQGTFLVQFVVNEEGEIENAEIVDGVLGQRTEDGKLVSIIRLNEEATSEVEEEIEKEGLIKLTEEQKDKIIEDMKAETQRAIEATSGNWQPAMQEDQKVKMVMVLPVRFTVDDN